MAIRPDGTGVVSGYQIRPGANLVSAYLAFENLTGADLTQANLTDAFLEGADLTGAILYDADLYGADLRNAHLTGADLTFANLRQTDFTGATVDPHHVPLIEAACMDMINSLKLKVSPYKVLPYRTPNPGRKVISPDLTGVNAAEAAEREYAMGDEETAVGIVPVHIYSDGKRVYFFSDAVDANEFLETLPPSIKSRAKIGNDFSSTTVTLYPPDRVPRMEMRPDGTTYMVAEAAPSTHLTDLIEAREAAADQCRRAEKNHAHAKREYRAAENNDNIDAADLMDAEREYYNTVGDLEDARRHLAEINKALAAARRTPNPGYGHHRGYGRRR